ncbi:TonB-dependent receptor [bacterium]|nr:TonB-dependent receptor [bacterium]
MKKSRLSRFFMILIVFTQTLYTLYAQKQNMDELLDLSLEELANVHIITTFKIPQKIKEVPAVIRVITDEQIRNNGYLTLEEALSTLPGMQFRNINSFNSYVFMRGAPSQNNLILVLIDGIQINELNSGGFYGGAQYNLSNVERIEIVYGPASALYGTNAISGIINIITKKPEKYSGLDLNALAGTFNTMHINMGYGYWNSSKKMGFRISGSAKTSEKADLKEKAGDNNWTASLENFEDDYSVDANVKWYKFCFELNYLEKRSSAATYNKSVGTDYRDTGTFWDIRFFNTALKHDTDLGPKTVMSSQIYYRNTSVLDNSVLVVTDTAQIGYYRPNSLFGFESMIHYSTPKRFDLITGILYENENLARKYSNTYSTGPDIRPRKPDEPPMEYNTLLSIYGQTKLFLTPPVELYAGARFDNSSAYHRVFTPRLGLVYNKNSLTAKLIYMEAFRAPKPWDYANGLGNPLLKSERIRSYELYASRVLMPDLVLNFSIYSNRLSNLLVKESYADESWRWINHGQLNTNGYEICVEYRKRKIRSSANYTWNNSTDENNRTIPEISRHCSNLILQYSLSGKFHFSIGCHYIGRRKNTRTISTTGSNFVDAAFIVHSALTYVLSSNWEMQLAVKNLKNAEYYHTSNLSPDRYRQPQRTVIFKAGYHLK